MRPAASIAALVVLSLVFACPGCGGDEAAEGEPSPAPGPPVFSRRFVDVTEASGIRFFHQSGGHGEKLLPETVGSGAAFLDYDGDGVLDVFLVNSGRWPGEPEEGAPRCALYRGLGGGRFEDVSAETGAGISLYGMGVAVADHDGDGDTDIYVTAVGDGVLLQNEGGRFRDVTAEAGLAGDVWTDAEGRSHPFWSTAAAFLDADGDGDLDLFVAGYCKWTRETDIFTTLDGVTKAFTTPDRYAGLPCRLFLDRGDGRYERAGPEWGLDEHLGKALGIAVRDLDEDGRLDVVVANDTRPNFLFLNRGGRFEERGQELGIAYDEFGRARAGMGIDVADYGNDGVPGVAIGNFAGEPMSLYRWQGAEGFAPDAGRAGLAPATLDPLAFGLLFRDLDLDGRLDLVIANGHIEPDIARFQADQSHAQAAQVFLGGAGGRFREVPAVQLGDLPRPLVGRGLCAGDIDGDGDLDLLLTANDGAARLFENRLEAGAPEPRRLRLRLVVPTGGNREALGARVELRSAAGRQTRVVASGGSYLSESERTLTFGLGEVRGELELIVRWPDGQVTERKVGASEVEIVLSR